jgi:hypothetical protein
MEFPELIDASLLAAFKSCPQLCKKTYFEHYKSKGQSVHLLAGGAFAKGMEVAREAFYCGTHDEPRHESDPQGQKHLKWVKVPNTPDDQDEAVALGMQALLAFYGDFECPPDSAKSAERMVGAFEFYFHNYPLDHTNDPILLPGGKRAIELSFAEPIPISHPVTGNPLLYCGRLDAILNFAGGHYVTDEKTTTQLGASWSRQWDLRSQFTGYAWGARQTGIKVDGALVRGVSILKTKYETQQAPINHPDWKIDRWYEEMLNWVRDLTICWDTGKFRHNLDHACAEYGGCQFRDACSTQDETPWLETYFEKRKWNPLLRTESKL